MEFLRAFIFIFKDQRWLIKLLETALFAVLCPLPVIGLICLCALLGYLAEICHNVSRDYPRPLPEWNHIGEDIGKGVHVFMAIALYHLPMVVVVGLLYIARETLAVSLFGSLTFAGALAAILPLLLFYLAFAWALLATGLVSYAESWDAGAFYQFNKLLRSLGNHGALTIQWLLSSLAASIILLLLLPLAPFLFIPAQGYLAGVYSRRLRAGRMQMRDAHTMPEPTADLSRLGFAGPKDAASLRRSETGLTRAT